MTKVSTQVKIILTEAYLSLLVESIVYIYILMCSFTSQAKHFVPPCITQSPS